MRKAKRTILIAMLICVGLVSVCPAGSDVMEKYRAPKKQKTAVSKRPAVMELLDKFTETADKTHTSFVTRSKIHVHDNIKPPANEDAGGYGGERDKFLIKEFRTDGKRMKIITQMWFDKNHDFANSKDKRQYSSHTFDGVNRYDHNRPYNGAGSVRVSYKRKGINLGLSGSRIAYEDPTSQSFGYLIGDLERFDRILRKVDPSKISVKKDELNGTTHYVIDAETNGGQYRVWLNPEKGYNFSRAAVVRKEGDIYFGSYKVEPGTSKRSVTENTDFKEVDGLWVPVKTKSKMNYTLPNGGYVRSDIDIELTSIVINPDHDALESFLVDDIKNGSRANISGVEGITYTWRDGKLIDKDGKKVDMEKIHKEPKKGGK